MHTLTSYPSTAIALPVKRSSLAFSKTQRFARHGVVIRPLDRKVCRSLRGSRIECRPDKLTGNMCETNPDVTVLGQMYAILCSSIWTERACLRNRHGRSPISCHEDAIDVGVETCLAKIIIVPAAVDRSPCRTLDPGSWPQARTSG
jgi:hypothetical protein